MGAVCCCADQNKLDKVKQVPLETVKRDKKPLSVPKYYPQEPQKKKREFSNPQTPSEEQDTIS